MVGVGELTAGGGVVERGLAAGIVVHPVPVLLGDGVPFLAVPGGVRVDLDLVDTERTGSVTSLRYRVKRGAGDAVG